MQSSRRAAFPTAAQQLASKHIVSGRICDVLKIVCDVAGRMPVPGRELILDRAVPGRLDAVAGRSEKDTAVLGRDAFWETCELIDLAVIGRAGAAPWSPPPGGTETDLVPAGTDAAGAAISVAFSSLCAGFPNVELEAGRSAMDPDAEGLREIVGVLLREPPTFRTSAVTSWGLRSSPIMTRVSKTSVSFWAASRRDWCSNLRGHARRQTAMNLGHAEQCGGELLGTGEPTRCSDGAPTTR